MKTSIVANFMKTRQAQPPPPVLLDELMVEILSRLPVKSLLRFRCVCKSWKSTILDPKFVKLHLRRSATKANLLLGWIRESFCEFLVPCSVRPLFGNPSSSIFDEDDCFPLNDDIIGSCNGLVCFLGDSNQYPPREYRFWLCNPATKLTSKEFAFSCVTEGSYCDRFAFGYDNVSDTYKLLTFFCNRKAKEESQKHQMKICSLGDTCWRNLHSFPVIPFFTIYNEAVYLNGTLNWLALCKINSDVIAQYVIVSLDLGMETCTQLLPPRVDETAPIEPTIGVLIDCLCFSHDSNRTHFVVWQMKEFGVEKSWTQFMKVSYQDLQFDWVGEHPLIPLCTSEKGDVLIIATRTESQAILYHRSDNKVERTKLPESIYWYHTVGYVESLVSPSSITDLQPLDSRTLCIIDGM